MKKRIIPRSEKEHLPSWKKKTISKKSSKGFVIFQRGQPKHAYTQNQKKIVADQNFLTL